MPVKDGTPPIADRRRLPRIQVPFPARIQGTDATGAAFEIETILDDLCGRGFYVRMQPLVNAGSELDAEISLATSRATPSAPRIKVKATVLRAEPRPGGTYGVAVTFDHPRFVYP